jgi:medium-chain acyl-[acyl-carrier-protein] hydrolase
VSLWQSASAPNTRERLVAERRSLPWFVVPFPRRAPRVRLICCPFAGGAASFYRPWSAALPADIEVWAAQLPGREARFREPPLEHMDDIVAGLARELRTLDDDVRLALFGHSMGALVAFELARALGAVTGPRASRLFVSACAGPRLERSDLPSPSLSDREFIAEIRRLGGTPEQVLRNDELMQLYLPLLRGDFAVSANYRYAPAPLLDCPIVAFGGLADRTVSRERLLPWAAETTAPFSLRMLTGDHFYLVSAQAELLSALSEAL